jgi:hypothetical protein
MEKSPRFILAPSTAWRGGSLENVSRERSLSGYVAAFGNFSMRM